MEALLESTPSLALLVNDGGRSSNLSIPSLIESRLVSILDKARTLPAVAGTLAIPWHSRT